MALPWGAQGYWSVDGWTSTSDGNDLTGYQTTITSPSFLSYDELEEWNSVIQKAINDFALELSQQ